MTQITKLILLLVIIFGLIGFLYSSNTQDKFTSNIEKSQKTNSLITISKENEVYSKNNIIVNERVVNGGIAENVVIKGNDGKLYNVKSGNVLVSDVVITANDEKTSIYRVSNQNKVEFIQ